MKKVLLGLTLAFLLVGCDGNKHRQFVYVDKENEIYAYKTSSSVKPLQVVSIRPSTKDYIRIQQAIVNSVVTKQPVCLKYSILDSETVKGFCDK